MIGTFSLSPKMIDGVKHLRVEGNVKLEGLLFVASGGKICNICNTGGEIMSFIAKYLFPFNWTLKAVRSGRPGAC